MQIQCKMLFHFSFDFLEVPLVGFEPTTNGLEDRHSSTELQGQYRHEATTCQPRAIFISANRA